MDIRVGLTTTTFIMERETEFAEDVIEQIKEIKTTFPDSSLRIHFATAEQIEQIKEAALVGVSMRQRKSENKV